MRKIGFVLFIVAACESSESAKPDPWATKPSTASSDPWATSSSEPSAPTPTPPAPPAPVGDSHLDGHWACQIPTSRYNSYSGMNDVSYAPAGVEFIIEGNQYRTAKDSGTVSVDQKLVTFRGGYFEGWPASENVHSDGSRYLIFRKDRSDPRAKDYAGFGDYHCARINR